MLIPFILENLKGMFTQVNDEVANIASQVGTTPQGWNGPIFDMIKTLSETIIIPIAGGIVACIMTYELIQMVIDRNNLQDFQTFVFYKWIAKTFIAVLLVTNAFPIVQGIFDIAQYVVQGASGVIGSSANIDIMSALGDVEGRLQELGIGSILMLCVQTLVCGLAMQILSVCIFIVLVGRMLEIYLVTSLGPLPLATMVNREWGHIGQNYLRTLLALGFQAFLIMVITAIYAILVQNITVSSDIEAAVWSTCGYSVLLCFMLFKTGSLSKAIFGAH